jgi:hypothetical protein
LNFASVPVSESVSISPGLLSMAHFTLSFIRHNDGSRNFGKEVGGLIY